MSTVDSAETSSDERHARTAQDQKRKAEEVGFTQSDYFKASLNANN